MNQEMMQNIWDRSRELQGSIDRSDYKSVVLGLVFLRYVSSVFEEKYQALLEEGDGFEEDEEAYLAENIFFIPPQARWSTLRAEAHTPEIGRRINEAMMQIERSNSALKGVMPTIYTRPELRSSQLGDLIDLLSFEMKEGEDVLGAMYEFLLRKFGTEESEFYTPACLVDLMVELLEPYSGRIYDPCFGSGGTFVRSAKFVERHRHRKDAIHVYGQEINAATWKLGKMNLAIRGIDCDLGGGPANTLTNDLHRLLKADFIFANPPYGQAWDAEKVADDPRWVYGVPPANNANYAWLQHILSKLSPTGVAAVLTSRSCGAEVRSWYNDIKAGMLRDNCVECIVSLPSNLFSNTNVGCNLWILSRSKERRTARAQEILFVDVSALGEKISPSKYTLPESLIRRIADKYHAWKNGEGYDDEIDFCHSVPVQEVERQSFLLQPSRYIMSSEEPAPETSELIGAYRSQLPFLQQDALGNSVADLLCGEEGFRFSGRRASLSEFVQSVPLIGPGKTTEAEQTEDSLHYLKISNFSFGLTNREAVMRIRKDFVKPHKLDKYLAQPNDIMIANLGTGASIGKLALTRPCDLPAVYNTNLFVLRRVSSEIGMGLLFLAVLHAVQKAKKPLRGAAGQNHFNTDDILGFEFCLPGEGDAQAARMIEELFSQWMASMELKDILERLQENLGVCLSAEE